MPTETDSQVYQTADSKVVKTATIKGQPGKQIKVESWTASIANKTKGIKTSLTTYMKYSGKRFAVAGWGATTTEYTPQSYNKYSYTADAGEDVILQWELKTDKTNSTAFMKDAAYTYFYVDVVGTPVTETPVTEKKEFIIIECKESETADLVTKIKGIAPNVSINTLSKYSK